MSPAPGQRIVTLDVAKGIGIVLVVLGHNPVFRENAKPLYEAVYLFHMPLFFFLSGMTFRFAPAEEALRKRARSLLVPYFVMGAIAVALALQADGMLAALTSLGGILYGTGHTLRFVPLWFLPCLFLVSMAATGALSGARTVMGAERFERLQARVLMGLVAVGLIGGVLILASGTFTQPPFVDVKGRPLGLPWSLDLVPFVLALFVLGTLASRRPFALNFPFPWLVIPVSAGVIALLVANHVSLDLNYRRMTDGAAVVLGMAAGIAMVLALSRLIVQVGWAARMFSYLGSASLVILMLHSPLQRRMRHAFVSRDVPDVIAVVAMVAITIALICAFDRWILRRVRAVGWVVYPRRGATA
jgi:fucose 4-O-acetylase-like acetyltransferase